MLEISHVSKFFAAMEIPQLFAQGFITYSSLLGLYGHCEGLHCTQNVCTTSTCTLENTPSVQKQFGHAT